MKERVYIYKGEINLSVIGLRGHFLQESLREISFLIRLSAESIFCRCGSIIRVDIYIYIFFFIGFTVVTGKSDVSILSLVIG